MHGIIWPGIATSGDQNDSPTQCPHVQHGALPKSGCRSIMIPTIGTRDAPRTGHPSPWVPRRHGMKGLKMSELKPRDPAPLNGSMKDSKSPMASWSHTVSFYGGSQVITELYDWDANVPSFITDVLGFGPGAVAHMSVTFVERGTGEIVDVHDHYFAGGDVLEKVREGFKFGVVSCWRTSRKLSSTFPAYTVIDMNTLLDPFVDYQNRYFNTYDYAEITASGLKSASLKVHMRRRTPKRNTYVAVDVLFDAIGRVVGCDCLIERRSHQYIMRTRPDKSGDMFIKELAYRAPGNRRKKVVLFSATSNNDYQRQLRYRGLVEDKPDLSANASSKRSNNSSKKKVPRGHAWTPEEEVYIAEHPELTARDLSAKFGVTPKAVERKRAAIRKKEDAFGRW